MTYFTDSRYLIRDNNSLNQIAGGRNIFGKRVSDYNWLQDIKRVKGDDQLYFDTLNKLLFADSAIKYTGRTLAPHATIQDLKQGYSSIFNKKARKVQFRDTSPAQGIQYFVSNIEAIMTEIKEIYYSKIRFPEWLPITTNIPNGAPEYLYNIVDRHGYAAFVDDGMTNAPLVGVTAQSVSIPLRLIANKSKLALREIEIANFSNLDLSAENIKTAILALNQKIEDLVLGVDPDTAEKQIGILNSQYINIKTETTPWNNLGNTNIVVNKLLEAVTTIIKQTKEIFGGIITGQLGIYVSHEMSAFLNSPREYTDKTIWTAFVTSCREIWQGPVSMIVVDELSTAGADGENRVMIGYPDSKEVWEYPLPREPQLATTQNLGSLICNEYHAIGGIGVSFLRPGGLLYIDNVFNTANPVPLNNERVVNPVTVNTEQLARNAKINAENLKKKKETIRKNAEKQNYS